MSAVIAPGMLVRHTVWGLGKVVETPAPYVIAYFSSLLGTPDGPRRRLHLDAPQLAIADVQSDPHLDGVPLGPAARTKARGSSPRQRPRLSVLHTLEQAIDWFTRQYPAGFADQALIDHELRYKRMAHSTFLMHFGKGKGKKLIEAGALSEIALGLADLYHATNIPSRFEVMAACDGLKDERAAASLLQAVLTFVDGPGPDSFEGVANAVAKLPAPSAGSRVLTWPNVTILPFLADPSRFMVLKPGVSNRIVARMNFDLPYSSSVTWHAYEALGRMSEELRERLAPLGARDFIDVQSFMWVTRDLE